MSQIVIEDRGTIYDDKGEVFSNKSALAIIVITGGFLLMLTGIILSIISFVSHGKFHGWDVITLITSFILLALGSHFLDKADIAKKNARIEFDNNSNLKIDEQFKAGKSSEN